MMQSSMHHREMSSAVIESYDEGTPGHFETLDVYGKGGNKMVFFFQGPAHVKMLQDALATSGFAPQEIPLAAYDAALALFKERRPDIAARMDGIPRLPADQGRAFFDDLRRRKAASC